MKRRLFAALAASALIILTVVPASTTAASPQKRFTRIDPETLRYRVTVEDPDTWATPWTAEWRFTATEARMFGVECHEGNYAIENFLRGARASERQKPRNQR